MVAFLQARLVADDQDRAGRELGQLVGVLEDGTGRGPSGARPHGPLSGHPGHLEFLDDPVDQLLGLLEALAPNGRRDGVVELADVQDVDGPSAGAGQLDRRRIALRLCSDWSTASSSFSSIEHLQGVRRPVSLLARGWDNRRLRHYHAGHRDDVRPVFPGRVAQLARARRLQRQTRAIFPSGGDQQEQPFMQVRAEYSVSSE